MRCIAIVRFPAPAGMTGAKLRAVLDDGVPRYQGLPGLHRKYFLGNVTHGAGVYEWESRAAADAFYNDAWRVRLRTVYGAVPQIEFFDLHAVVDNDAGTARIDAAAA
jgi:hypothetical protein